MGGGGDVRQVRGVVAQALAQGGGQGGLVRGHAQVALEALQVVLVQRERGLAVDEQRVLGDGGGDVGVAVAVAAHPGAEAQQGGHGEGMARIVAGERRLEVGIDAGHDLPQRVLEVVEPVVHLVEDGGRALVDLFREPQRRDLLADAVLDLRALAGRQPRVVERLREAGQAAQLVEHGAAARFRGMRGEDGLDEQAVQPALQVLGGHAGGGRGRHRFRDRLLARGLRAGLGGGALALAQHAEAVALLGHVHEMEVRGERAHDQARLVQGQGVRAPQQRLALGPEVARPAAVRAQGLGLGAVLLDQRKAGLAFLLAQDLAQQAAEGVDVAPERVLLGFARAARRVHGDDCMLRPPASRRPSHRWGGD